MLEAPVVERDFGGYRFTVVYLPGDLVAELGLQGRVRCRGLLGKAPLVGAWQRSQGRWFLLVSQKLLKASGYAPGDWARVAFRLTPDDDVDVPDELRAALDGCRGLREKWDALTPGLQRSYAYRVSSARTPATRERRVDEVIGWVADERSRPRRGK